MANTWNFKSAHFFIWWLAVIVLYAPIFFANFAYDEGNENVLSYMGMIFSKVYEFPLVIIWNLFEFNTEIEVYLLLLLLNTLGFAFVGATFTRNIIVKKREKIQNSNKLQ